MTLLSRFKIRTKLALLLGLFGLGFAALAATDAAALHARMLRERVGKLQATVDMFAGYATEQERLVAAGQITAAQEMSRLRDMAHATRFDGGAGYLTVQSLDAVVLIHGADPSREDKPSTATDAGGTPIIELIKTALRTGDSGTIAYAFPKPGQTVPQPKYAYVRRLPPLRGVILAGTYTDDLDADFHAQLISSIGFGGGILLATLIVAWMVGHDITGSLERLKTTMAALAKGALRTDVPDTGRRDEIGEMAAAVQVFKDNALAIERMKADQETAARRAEDEKHNALARLAGEFEVHVGTIVDTVASAAVAMEKTAGSMTAATEQTTRQATAAAVASERASANVLSVADAAEKLTGSVTEISRQVAFSAEIAGKAVTESERTNALVGGLTDAAQKIGAPAAVSPFTGTRSRV